MGKLTTFLVWIQYHLALGSFNIYQQRSGGTRGISDIPRNGGHLVADAIFIFKQILEKFCFAAKP